MVGFYSKPTQIVCRPTICVSLVYHMLPLKIVQTWSVFGKSSVDTFIIQDKVSETAMKWSKVSKTGGLEVKFMGVDLSTVMFTMEAGQDMDELKDFILDQPDAYEVKIGDNVYRRSGDPPIEEVIEMLQKEKDDKSPAPREHEKDEL
ncbi:uncharacterized protein LOC104887231 isoform X2 [Beta vulgaris subsp. vulgaris]|uniref:uncharacterized protein LOC104887231 isoform X2 n=1 Tax=Beta vulgaris subsp. vulgaris TaxID=3555 RepID=UPI00203689D5|nr:uncharacterized protein LOC104887231 isoform X2 [Beta vulgaris subsp. vulgaris]